MTRYASVIIYCDHKTAGRICDKHAAGPDDTIAGNEAAREGWLSTIDGDFCPGHRAEHAPKPLPRVRKPKPPPPDTLDELLEIPA